MRTNLHVAFFHPVFMISRGEDSQLEAAVRTLLKEVSARSEGGLQTP